MTGGERGGEPRNALNGSVMTVTRERFRILASAGSVRSGTLRLDATTRPAQMDFLHDDGGRWEAVIEATGDVFRINYVDASSGDPRPTGFTTSAGSAASVVVLERRDEG